MNKIINFDLTLSRLATCIIFIYSLAFIALSFSLYCTVAHEIGKHEIISISMAETYIANKIISPEKSLTLQDTSSISYDIPHYIACNDDIVFSHSILSTGIGNTAELHSLLKTSAYEHKTRPIKYNGKICTLYTVLPRLYTSELSKTLFKQFIFYTIIIFALAASILVYFIWWWKRKVALVSNFIRNKDKDVDFCDYTRYSLKDFSDIISSVKFLKAELSARNENALAFSHHVAHELRLPLQRLLFSLEMALFDKDASEDVVSLSSSLLNEVSRLKTIVDSLFFLFERNEDLLSNNKEYFSLCSITSDVVGFYSPLTEDRGIILDYRCEGELYGNKEFFSRLLFNVISNSIKYSSINDKISILFHADDNEVLLEVSDTGSGIQADDLPKVFEPFFRSEQVKHTTSGLGLGLSLVRKIVDALEGRINIESTYGAGTKIIINIPRVQQ